MSWYTLSSIKDDKQSQASEIIAELEKCVESAMGDSDKNIMLLKSMIKRLRGKRSGFRVIIKRSTAKAVAELLEMAIQVKKDSPHEFSRLLGDAMSLLVCEAE